jgi:hypothetical protein
MTRHSNGTHRYRELPPIRKGLLIRRIRNNVAVKWVRAALPYRCRPSPTRVDGTVATGCGSQNGWIVQFDPERPRSGEHLALERRDCAGSVVLTSVVPEGPGGDDVLLACMERFVDAGRGSREHDWGPSQVACKGGRGVERGPHELGSRRRPRRPTSFGRQGHAITLRPSTGPGNSRRPSPSWRSGPHPKHVGNGWLVNQRIPRLPLVRR